MRNYIREIWVRLGRDGPKTQDSDRLQFIKEQNEALSIRALEK